MTFARDLAARLVPESAKRRHEAWASGRHVRRVRALNRDFVAQHGLDVRRGPFTGMGYPESLALDSGDLVAKLVGTYELELHDAIGSWIDRGWKRIVNVGAAEGFYAVGLARAIPEAEVLAYDIDPTSRDRCLRLARHNAVESSVNIRARCEPADLDGPPSAVLVDCEGCELQLLDPARAPALAHCELLVELHDFLDETISATLLERFGPTHDIEVISGGSRRELSTSELEGLARSDRQRLLGERRPGPMQWAWMRARR